MHNEKSGFIGDLGNWLRGVCMGAADIVPGVSGGTIALILGHYQRLVTAISHVDLQFLRLLRQRELGKALVHVDFRFLVALGLGIASGIVALASLLHYLLENQHAYTFSVFTGLILSSSYLVARRLHAWNGIAIAWMLGGAIVAWQICRLQPLHGELTPLSAFLSATVAICAMILPGISGAFVLLLLGVYHPITELIKGLPRGEVTIDGLVLIGIFLVGCAVGLLAFSRLLRWLLARKHDATMAFLVGLMLGSLYKIWPFQVVTEATSGLPFKERQLEHVWPAESSVNAFAVMGLMLAAAVATYLLEQVGSRLSARTKANGSG